MISPTRIHLIGTAIAATSSEAKLLAAIEGETSIREIAVKADLSVMAAMVLIERLVNQKVVHIHY